MTIRTDLAIECREMFAEEICGVESRKTDEDGISVTHVEIKTEEGALRIGKPIGHYVTVEIDELLSSSEEITERGIKVVADEIKEMLAGKNADSVMVVGLGNRYITPDSIGPKVADKITVTRHITKEAGFGFDFNLRSVSAVSPGVLGITGIETWEIVKGVTKHVNPSLIIAVDALAARKLSRLGRTIQISDAGICPGSGVGNNRKEFSEKTLGVPVIAIGMPMVVDAMTLAEDIFAELPEKPEKMRTTPLSCDDRNMIVTPNDVDAISNQAATIIAEGINMALHS